MLQRSANLVIRKWKKMLLRSPSRTDSQGKLFCSHSLVMAQSKLTTESAHVGADVSFWNFDFQLLQDLLEALSYLLGVCVRWNRKHLSEAPLGPTHLRKEVAYSLAITTKDGHFCAHDVASNCCRSVYGWNTCLVLMQGLLGHKFENIYKIACSSHEFSRDHRSYCLSSWVMWSSCFEVLCKLLSCHCASNSLSCQQGKFYFTYLENRPVGMLSQ